MYNITMGMGSAILQLKYAKKVTLLNRQPSKRKHVDNEEPNSHLKKKKTIIA